MRHMVWNGDIFVLPSNPTAPMTIWQVAQADYRERCKVNNWTERALVWTFFLAVYGELMFVLWQRY